MGDKAWKRLERKVSELLGGRRIPVHSTEDIACDVVAPGLSVECKNMLDIPKHLSDDFAQAKGQVVLNTVPVLVWHGKGMSYQDSYVIIRLKDFAEVIQHGDKDSKNKV